MDPAYWRICLDLCCLALFAIPVLLYNFFDLIPVTNRGFFCNDVTIRYPYHNSSVHSSVNIVLAFAAVILMGLVVELYSLWVIGHKPGKKKQECRHVVGEVYRTVGYFVVGAAMNQVLTDFLKSTVGRLRPHFLEVCLPNVTCTTENQFSYMQNFVCTRESHPLLPGHKFAKALSESRKSFPSGHSSLAIFAFLYIVIFVEFRLRSDKHIRTVRHVLQLGLVVWPLYVCCSRIFDYKHHVTDVLAGMLLGATIAVFAAYLYICSYTYSHKKRSRREVNPDLLRAEVGPTNGRVSDVGAPLQENRAGATC